MKKIILIATGVVFSIAVASAQVDTTRSKKQKPSSSYRNSDSTSYRNYPNKDMARVKTANLPSSLHTTLQSGEYTGWETGTIYFNSKTNEYLLQLPPGNSSNTSAGTKTGWYRFDTSGKLIQDSKIDY